jgi:hypothetical protein
MARGLFWLPLLGAFFWLAWAGWNEYQKLEAYRAWAQQFERAKYDIYAVLGQNGSEITWGKPTRKGPIDLQTFSLKEVESIRLMVGDRPADLNTPPISDRNVALEFNFPNAATVRIPFTQVSLATQWGKYLLEEVERMKDKG